MKFRNTFILLILLIALGVYVYFIEVKQYRKTETVIKESKKVFSMVQDSLQQLTFRNSNGSFTIKKIQGQWKIVEPIYTEADESTVKSMLSTLLNSEKDKEFSIRPSETAEYGLHEQAIFIKLQTNKGEKDSLWMGDNTPVGAYVFGKKADSLIFTINQAVKNTFNKKLFDIRDKKILHFQRADVQQITVKNTHGQFEFEKANASDWTFKNINRPADNTKISSLLSKLENNRIKEFVDEEGSQLQKYGLDKPVFQVDLQLGLEKGHKRLFISKAIDKKYYARDESRRPIFEVDSFLVKDLNQKASDFRTKDLAAFSRFEINRFTIQYDDTLFTCVKDTADNWFLDDSIQQVVQKQKITSFLTNLDFTSISDYVRDGTYNPADYGLDKPSLRILLYKDNDLQIEVKFGKKKDKNYYAATNQYDSVYLIEEAKVKDVKLKLNDIIEKPLSSSEALSTTE